MQRIETINISSIEKCGTPCRPLQARHELISIPIAVLGHDVAQILYPIPIRVHRI